jgi:DNA polymerase-4
VERLVQHFGKRYGHWLSEAANGRDERPVVTVSEPKSVSRETTFERDLEPRSDREALTRILISLCERLSQDLTRKGCQGKTIGVKLRYEDFRTVTRDKTVSSPIGVPQAILSAARDCLKRVPLNRKLRLLGIRVSSLSRFDTEGANDAPSRRDPKGRMVGENLCLFD